MRWLRSALALAVAQNTGTQVFLAATLLSLLDLPSALSWFVFQVTDMDITGVAISRQLYLSHLEPEEAPTSRLEDQEKDANWLQAGSMCARSSLFV
jgi:hypothetical protein